MHYKKNTIFVIVAFLIYYILLKPVVHKISVVVPVYLGDKSVEILSKRLEKVLSSIATDHEIILVNDASPDDSWHKIKSLCRKDRRIKGIRLSRNFGQHPAISAGLKYASGDKVVIMDCDLQDAPEDLRKLWTKSQEGFDIVMARRTKRKESPWRRFLSWSFHQILSLRVGRKTDPAIANYAIYDRKVIEEYYANHRDKAFSVLNLKGNYSFATIEAEQHASAREKTSYSLSNLFALVFDLLLPGKGKSPLYSIEQTLNIALEGYGVRLIPLTGEKLETVRQWRNDPEISRHMEYREHITPGMQRTWFESVNNPNNHYSLVEFEGREIGLINAKNIDYGNKSGEPGLFIFDKSYLGSDLAFLASFCHGDFLTDILGLNRFFVHIMRDNKRSISFNKALGYKLLSGQENTVKQKYVLSAEDYRKRRDSIVRAIL